MYKQLLETRKDIKKLDDDFCIFSIKNTVLPVGPFKVGNYGFFLCQSGMSSGFIDFMPYEMVPGCLAVNIPNQLIEHGYTSEDFSGICVVMSRHFVDSLGLPYNFSLNVDIKESPVITLHSSQQNAIYNYCDMARNLLEKERPYQKETLRHLTCAYFYGLGAYLYQLNKNRRYSRDELLMQRFINEIRTYYRTERKVYFYAERLNVTAGYLSTLVSRISGKTANEWIDSFVVLEAKALLKSSSLTVQQISDELHFPSQSFFGKYFKRLTGMSPKMYRSI